MIFDVVKRSLQSTNVLIAMEDLLGDCRGSRMPDVHAARLTAAIAAWRPGPLPERYLDMSAPQISGPNVPPPGLAHRQAVMEYYQAKMRSLAGR